MFAPILCHPPATADAANQKEGSCPTGGVPFLFRVQFLRYDVLPKIAPLVV